MGDWLLQHSWGGRVACSRNPKARSRPRAGRRRGPARGRRAGRAPAGVARVPGRGSAVAARHTARRRDGRAGLRGRLVGHGGAEPAVSAPRPGAPSSPARAPGYGQGAIRPKAVGRTWNCGSPGRGGARGGVRGPPELCEPLFPPASL